MAPLRSVHCGDPTLHSAHGGRYRDSSLGVQVICDGLPASLARQQERAANPPPGPPSPPQVIEWEGSAGPEDDGLRRLAAVNRHLVLGRILERALTSDGPGSMYRYVHELDDDGEDDLTLDGSITLDADEANVVREVLRG